jgi:hypothetical protein
MSADIDAAERLSADDLATQRDAQFTAAALAAAMGARAANPTRGTCRNCAATLPSTWLYCDADCRADFEQREAIQARKGAR